MINNITQEYRKTGGFNSNKKQDSDLTPDYTVNQTMRILMVSRPTVYSLVSNGDLRLYKIGRHSRITKPSLDALRRIGA